MRNLLKTLPKTKIQQAILELTEDEAEYLLYDWELYAREEQLIPAGSWVYWLILAGRGWGKTRTGAETVKEWVKKYPYVNLIGATADDARDIMIQGESGILASCNRWEKPRYIKSERCLKWPNGAQSLIFTADEPERLRGKQHSKVWCDELCLIADTQITVINGNKLIQFITNKDYVLTRKGFKRVVKAWKTSDSSKVYTVTFSNGTSLTGTAGHPIFVKGKGFVGLRQLRHGDIISHLNNEGYKLCQQLNGTVKNGGSGQIIIKTEKGSCFTEKNGFTILGIFLKGMKFIIKITTKKIILSIISSYYRSLNTLKNICAEQYCGVQKKEVLRQKNNGQKQSLKNLIVLNVKKYFCRMGCALNFVRMSVSQLIAGRQKLITNKEFVFSVKNNSSLTNIEQQNVVPVFVLRVIEETQKQAVYNFEVEDEHEYYANGVLTHNCAWRYPESWDQAMFGLRLGDNPQAVITTTPRPTKLIKELAKDARSFVTTGTTYDNKANLATAFLNAIVNKYENTRLGRQELYAEVLDDNPNALFHQSRIDELRVQKAPELKRIGLGIDPSVTSNENSDETGIIIAAVGVDGHGYVLRDASLIATPDGWAKVVTKEGREFNVDIVVAETNNGGDLVEANLRTQKDFNFRFKKVHASRGKAIRAEPVAGLYEQGKIHHVGYFPHLEDQMCDFNPNLDINKKKDKSPDRMDALVWVFWELFKLGEPDTTGIIDYYEQKLEQKRQNEQNGNTH